MKNRRAREVLVGEIYDLSDTMELVYFTDVAGIKQAADNLFLEQGRLIRTLVPGSDIQHVGSTAIPGCLTKGI